MATLPLPDPTQALLNGPRLLPMPAMAGNPAPPTLPAPTQPNVLDPSSPMGRGAVANHELARLQHDGSGISQIHNTVGRDLLSVGDGILRLVAPRLEQALPGTLGHNQYLQQQQVGRLGQDLGQEQQQANIHNLNLQPQFKQMAAENAFLKTGGYLQHVSDTGQHYEDMGQHYTDQTDAGLAEHGYKRDPATGATVPMQYGEMSPQLQAIEDLKHAQTEQANAQADLKKAQNDKTSPAFGLAQQRADIAQQNANTALKRISLYGQSLDLRRQNTNAALYGTDNSGNALPGSAQIVGDNGQATTVGAKFAPAAIKQQKNVGSFNDLSGSIVHTRQALQQFFNEGGSLSDPRIVAAMSDPNSTVGKVINGKLVQAGLSPSAVTAINAVRQLHEQAGILRSTTGGTSSEAGAQRILDVVPSAGDANNVALNKLMEQDEVLKRLAPGQTRVTGGLSVQHQGGQQPQGGGVSVVAPNGKSYSFPDQESANKFKQAAGIK